MGQLYLLVETLPFLPSLLQLEHLQEVVVQSHLPFAQPHFVQLHLADSAFLAVSLVCAETEKDRIATKVTNNSLIDFIIQFFSCIYKISLILKKALFYFRN